MNNIVSLACVCVTTAATATAAAAAAAHLSAPDEQPVVVCASIAARVSYGSVRPSDRPGAERLAQRARHLGSDESASSSWSSRGELSSPDDELAAKPTGVGVSSRTALRARLCARVCARKRRSRAQPSGAFVCASVCQFQVRAFAYAPPKLALAFGLRLASERTSVCPPARATTYSCNSNNNARSTADPRPSPTAAPTPAASDRLARARRAARRCCFLMILRARARVRVCPRAQLAPLVRACASTSCIISGASRRTMSATQTHRRTHARAHPNTAGRLTHARAHTRSLARCARADARSIEAPQWPRPLPLSKADAAANPSGRHCYL